MKKTKITKIEKSTNDVHDIEVDGVRHYILENGVVSHNSYGAGQVMGGGGGLVFAADFIAIFSKAQYKEGEERVGSLISSTLEKGRDTKEKTKVKMLLHYQYGLHKYYGLLEWAVLAKMITKEGKKYSVDGELYSEKEVYVNAKKIFTEDFLKKLNEFMRPYFVYGGLANAEGEIPNDSESNMEPTDEEDGEPQTEE